MMNMKLSNMTSKNTKYGGRVKNVDLLECAWI